MFNAFMAVPVGTLAFAVLAIRELDQSFVDTYSTAISIQNIRPRWDRRVLALLLGTLATVFALALNVNAYENFLVLLGVGLRAVARRAGRRLLRRLAPRLGPVRDAPARDGRSCCRGWPGSSSTS